MDNTGRTVAKNAGVMMASQVITWILALSLTIFLPRYLGAEAVGQYQLAISIWAMMAIAINFGMDVLLTKEVARAPERCNELFSNSILLKLGIFILSMVVVGIYVRVAGYSKGTIEIINILSVSTLIWQVTFTSGAALQAFERMEYISLSDILGRAFATVISIVALLLGYKVVVIAWINVVASLISLAVQMYGLRKLYNFQWMIRSDLFGWILKSSLPYMLVSGFLIAYNQIDVIILSLLVDEKQIGFYSAASRLYGTFLFIPTVLITAVFPVFARLYKSDSDALNKWMTRTFNLLLLVGIPIGLGVFAIANPIIILLFGSDFSNSGPILAVMGIVIIITYLNAVLGKYFISIDRQNLWTWVMGIAALLSIPLDLMLVPWCQNVFGIGALGGSFSYLITEGGMLIVGLIFMPKGVLGQKTAWYAVRALFAGLVMAYVAWLLRDLLILAPILAGGIVYVALIALLRVIPPEDFDLLKIVSAKILARLRREKPQIASSG